MSYRDDLNAAHARIAALESELALQKLITQSHEADKGIAAPKKKLADTKSSMGTCEAEIFGATASADFKKMLAARTARQRPAVKSVTPLARAKARPLLFSAFGEAGQSVTVHRPSQSLFRGDELFAFDTAARPGHGTVIKAVFVGQQPQFEDIPTWMFYEWLPQMERFEYEQAAKLNGTAFETADTRGAAARLRIANAAARLTWATCYPALDITFNVFFRETGRWEAVLWGQVIS